MANKLLSKVIDDLGSLPSGELEKLVRLQMDEADMLEGIIGSLPEGHIVFSPEQRIVFINNAAYHLLPSDRRRRMKPGLKAEELLIDQDVKKFILAVFSGMRKRSLRILHSQKAMKYAQRESLSPSSPFQVAGIPMWSSGI